MGLRVSVIVRLNRKREERSEESENQNDFAIERAKLTINKEEKGITFCKKRNAKNKQETQNANPFGLLKKLLMLSFRAAGSVLPLLLIHFFLPRGTQIP